MNRLRYILIALLLSFIIIGTLSCNSSETFGSRVYNVPIADTPFPCENGTEWTYRFGDTEMKLVANGTAEHVIAGEVVVIEEWFRDDNDDWYLNNYDYLWISDKEVRRFDTLESDTYSVVIRYPLKLGKTWKYSPIDHPGWIATVVSIDNVVTPTGTFTDCYRIEYNCEDGYWGDMIRTTWYAPGVGGLYGVREEDGRVTELIGYKFPDEQVLGVKKYLNRLENG